MCAWKLIEHRADAGIRVESETLGGLFADAAAGMFFILLEGGIPEGWPASHTIRLDAPDTEQLLVDWLSELLYLFEVKHFIFGSAVFDSISGTELGAGVSGLSYSGTVMGAEVKAVTHHMLEIVRNDTGYSTDIYFDL